MIADWRLLLGLTGAAWIGYVFAGYPLLLAVVAWLRRVQPVVSDDFTPMVSVLISARNEEKDIEWKIEETLKWDYPPDRLEVWLASDASDDRTDEILALVEDPRFHFIRTEKRGGKNRALNRLAQLAGGEILFFTDANSHVDASCLRQMIRHFADPRVGSVTGDSDTQSADVPNSGTAVYWSHELLIRRLENKFGSVLVCDGAIFAIRRELYMPCFPDLANDLELPLRIGGAGYWLLHEPQAQVHENERTTPGEEFARRRRICAQGALGMWKLRSTLRGVRAWQFFSHKFLRWLLAVPLLMALASCFLLSSERMFAAMFAIQAGVWGLSALGVATARLGRVPRLLSPFAYLLVSAAGAFMGVVDACRGRRYDVWESPGLTRGVAAKS